MSEVKKMRVKGSGEIPCVTSLSDIRGGRGSLSMYSTRDLVEELDRRREVISAHVTEDESVEVTIYSHLDGEDIYENDIKGSATILIIRDGGN